MKSIFRSGEPRYSIDAEMADRILQTCFQANGREANTVPLEVLTNYSGYRQERYDLQKTALAVVLILFLLLPILFLTPGVSVTRQESPDDAPVYEIAVKSLMPIQSITAGIGEHSFPLTETSRHHYRVSPKTSGNMIVSVKLLNQQLGNQVVRIEGVDGYPPELLSSEVYDDHIELYLRDDLSGIDFYNIGVVYADGRSSAYSFDSETGCLSVPFPDILTEITVPDKNGNVFTIHLETEEE